MTTGPPAHLTVAIHHRPSRSVYFILHGLAETMPAMDKRGLTFGPCLSTGGHRHFLYRKKLFPRPGRFASQLATSIPVDGRRARPSDIPGIRNELNREPANQLKGRRTVDHSSGNTAVHRCLQGCGRRAMRDSNVPAMVITLGDHMHKSASRGAQHISAYPAG